nr:homeodomain transcription factor bE [Tranzscheliella williamsii]
MSTATICVADMVVALHNVENDMYRESEGIYSHIASQLSTVRDFVGSLSLTPQKDDKDLREIYKSAARIKTIADTFIELERSREAMYTEASLEASRVCLGASKSSSDLELSETLPSYQMRKHFLSTLNEPYPSQLDKEELVKATNAYHTRKPPSLAQRSYMTINQLTLWFINARRRSGWSSIMQRYAQNDRKRMKALIEAKMYEVGLPLRGQPGSFEGSNVSVDMLLRDNLGELTESVKAAFEDDWTSMVSWIKYGVKDKVGDWIRDIVVANKKSQPKKKACKPRQISSGISQGTREQTGSKNMFTKTKETKESKLGPHRAARLPRSHVPMKALGRPFTSNELAAFRTCDMSSLRQTPLPTLQALSASFTDLSTVLEPLLDHKYESLNAALQKNSSAATASASSSGDVDELGGRLDAARLQVSVAYVLMDLVWILLKTKGVDATSHPVLQELERVKGYFGKIKRVQEAANEEGERPAVDRSAAGRFIRAALAANGDTPTVAKHTKFDDDAATKPIEAAPEPAAPPKPTPTRKRPAMDPFAGYDAPSTHKTAPSATQPPSSAGPSPPKKKKSAKAKKTGP